VQLKDFGSVGMRHWSRTGEGCGKRNSLQLAQVKSAVLAIRLQQPYRACRRERPQPPSFVMPDVELIAVAAHLEGGRETLERILRRQLRRARWADDVDTLAAASPTRSCRRMASAAVSARTSVDRRPEPQRLTPANAPAKNDAAQGGEPIETGTFITPNRVMVERAMGTPCYRCRQVQAGRRARSWRLWSTQDSLPIKKETSTRYSRRQSCCQHSDVEWYRATSREEWTSDSEYTQRTSSARNRCPGNDSATGDRKSAATVQNFVNRLASEVAVSQDHTRPDPRRHIG